MRFIARRSFPALPSCVALATSKSRRLVFHSFRWCLAIRRSRWQTLPKMVSHCSQSAPERQWLNRRDRRMSAVSARDSAHLSSTWKTKEWA